MDLQQNIEASASYAGSGVSRGSEQTERPDVKTQSLLRNRRSADDAPSVPAGRKEESERTEGLHRDTVRQMLDSAESKLEMHGVSLRFKINDDAEGVQVEVRDPKTDKIIRKIPEDEMLRLSSHIKDFNGDLAGALAGTLMDKPI
ncbi:flagellar protein FlaG [Paucidesulfovibrio longus]|uniref:flagellar protein FlaG n=1 Tax=Paucidesulfovibrio longus TaxID=889 RepID=UPI0003B5C71B|nr:flagellar protein FlaG [Paucidesulfovibrio longus]